METKALQAYDPSLELRMIELGFRFLYKIRKNTTYTESLNTQYGKENQNYEENKRATRPTVAHLRETKQRYMKKQKKK